MSAHLLLIEDDPSLMAVAKKLLVRGGYRVTTATSSEEALLVLKDAAVDLVVSDVRLPGLSGIKFVQILRGEPATARLPVLLLTVADAPADKVTGLKAGADDYLAKPYDPNELLARVEALLRRASPGTAPAEGPVTSGELAVDPSRREVSVSGSSVRLTRKEFDLLLALVQRVGHVFTRSALNQLLWGEDAVVTENTLDVHLRNLRRKLGPAGARIETLIGVGFRLAPPA
jgi:DNA-binding response OmpR family regulator